MTEETKKLLEEQIQIGLEGLSWTCIGKDADESRSRTVGDVAKLIEKLNEAEQNDEKRSDNQERREIDRERNQSTVELERQKQDLTWKRFGIEVAKIIIPVTVPLIAYSIYQKRLLKFEETGRVCSTAGRELHLPKIFNKTA